MSKTKLFGVVVLSLALLISAGAVGVTAQKTITIAEQTWTGIKAKNAIVGTILEKIGYDVKYKTVIGAPMWQGLSTGDLDVWFGAWPSQSRVYEPLLKEGKIVKLGYNLRETKYCLAVPEYVWEAGVKSMEDLDKFREKFDATFTMGEPGGAATQYMEKAVKEDIYGLGDWKVTTGSFQAEMSEVKAKIEHHEWVVFAAWTPHWMNYEWNIKYLDDPQQLWEGSCSNAPVMTAARKGLKEDMPNVYKFFKQVHTTPEMANEWIYKIDKKNMDRFKLAENWIKENIDVVDQWLWEVKDASGERLARHVLREKLGI